MSLPSVETILFEFLVKEREAEERAPSLLVDKLHANASSAGACARQISFRVLGVESSNPITGDALFNFYLGDAVHDKIQTAMLTKIPNAEKELSGVVADFITCRADLKYPAEDGKMICNEIKSVSDFAFKLATGKKLKSNGQWNKKDQVAEGPKREHILQVGISAKAIDCDYLAITYARKTAAKDEPIIHEWRFKVSDFEQEIQAEIERLKRIILIAIEGKLAEREYEGVTLVDPTKTRWPCSYCGYLDTCAKLGSGVVPLTKAAE